VCVALFAFACEPPGGAPEGEGVDDGVDDGEVIDGECDRDSNCSPGELCLSATCVFADCDPLLEEACDAGEASGSHCCGIAERCSEVSFECEPTLNDGPCDPADATCIECVFEQQCSAGQVCAAGLCLNAATQQACTQTFQCGDAEHCDRDLFLCVPLRPCAACGPQLPHLCCFDDEVCLTNDDAGGACVIPPPRECEADDDCAAGLFCDLTGACVQCNDTVDCGPGLTCNVEEGVCTSESTCLLDEECNDGERCAQLTRECVVPECVSSEDCNQEDPRRFCDVSRFLCDLLDPVCSNDSDEENDAPEAATPLELDVPFAGSLCRGDSDVLSFPVAPATRYVATVALEGAPGVNVTMRSAASVQSAAAFASGANSVSVEGLTGEVEAVPLFVVITGSSDAADQWSYVVTVTVEPFAP
jgi:hypothetical protein